MDGWDRFGQSQSVASRKSIFPSTKKQAVRACFARSLCACVRGASLAQSLRRRGLCDGRTAMGKGLIMWRWSVAIER